MNSSELKKFLIKNWRDTLLDSHVRKFSTMAELAEKSGVSRSGVTKAFVHGQITLLTLRKLCDALEVKTETLFVEKGTNHVTARNSNRRPSKTRLN